MKSNKKNNKDIIKGKWWAQGRCCVVHATLLYYYAKLG